MTSHLGRTLLHCAVLGGDLQQAQLIAAASPDQTRMRDVMGMTAQDLAERMIHRFSAGSAMHDNLVAIIAFLAQLPQPEPQDVGGQEQGKTQQRAPMGQLLRSSSDTDAHVPLPVIFTLKLGKAASDGNVPSSRVETAETRLRSGTQQFTPLTILKLTSDTDGEVQQLQALRPASAEVVAELNESKVDEMLERQLSPEEELAALSEYIVRNELNDPSREILKYSTEKLCEVCFHNPIVAGESPKACDQCDVAICVDCLFSFTQSTVDSALYAVPAIRCPGCLTRIRTSVWSKILTTYCQHTNVEEVEGQPQPQSATELLINKYTNNASHLMTFRCGYCDQTQTLFNTEVSDAEGTRTDKLAALLSHFPDTQTLQVCRLWKAFDCAEINALAFVTDVMGIFITTKKADDSISEEELMRFETYKIIPDTWPVSEVRQALQDLISDVERRVGFLLAFYSQFPKYTTECCYCGMCFMCKMSDWHEGRTCAEVQHEQTADAEFCPGCGVATLRTQGCRHIVCVCGTEWTWEGGADYEE